MINSPKNQVLRQDGYQNGRNKQWTSFTISGVGQVLPLNIVHCFQGRFHIHLGYWIFSHLSFNWVYQIKLPVFSFMWPPTSFEIHTEVSSFGLSFVRFCASFFYDFFLLESTNVRQNEENQKRSNYAGCSKRSGQWKEIAKLNNW